MNFEKISSSVVGFLPRLSVLVYPTQKVLDTVFSLALNAVKYVSYDRAKIGSALFDIYFSEILQAKKLQKQVSLKPNLGEIGAVIETAKLTYAVALIVLGFMYLYFVFAIPTFLYATLQSVVSVKIIVALAGAMTIYYTGLLLFLAAKLFKRQVPQVVIKSYLKEEFAYVYAKAAEIDQEVADITIDYLKDSLLIHSDDHYAAHIAKLTQKIEEK